MKPELRVLFEPSGRKVHVLPGTTLFEAAARAGLLLQSPCGGKGTCGKCQVRVTSGACSPTESCTNRLGAARTEQGWRLACQARIQADCVIEVPAASLYESSSKILTTSVGREVRFDPCVWKRYTDLPRPTNEDDVSDLKRLERIIGPVRVHLDLLRELPLALRSCDFHGTAVVCCQRLIAFEPGDTTAACYGVAFDLGTTTLVGTLVDLVKGREIAVAACLNPQVAVGDDVVTRILRVRENPGTLREMQGAVVGAFNDLIRQLTAECGVDPVGIYEITVAGNTTMQHILCGITPHALGELPFTPAYSRGLMFDARDVGLLVHPNARLYVFPNIGGFVGGDTVAGILATGIYDETRAVLFVDIGTNGEIVLAHKGRLQAASTAAGPAFEGARISAGMRATDGAIEKIVRADSDIWYNVIANTPPVGLCGTALIDLAAELLRLGIVDPTGRLLPPDEVPAEVPPALRARLHQVDDEVRFQIVPAEESKTGEPICLHQRDIRELQLATGAIRAGIAILLRREGLTPGDLQEVLLAGGFGNFIRRSNARRLGLLPQMPSARIRFVGNSSSMGAKAALLSQEARQAAERIAESTSHVDLSLDPEFQMEFSSCMLFPEDEYHTE